MAEIITIDEARAACRIDGSENDHLIEPIRQASERYITSAVGEDRAVRSDPRVVAAVQAHVRLSFRPLEDKQGNLQRHVTSLIKQIATDILPESEVEDNA